MAFDENIVSDKADQSIIISPANTVKPVFKTLQHGLSISVDTIMPEKFSIQFLSQTIKDLNEKNPMADTTLFIQATKTLDSVPTLYYHSGNIKASYQLTKLENISVYQGDFRSIPATLHGYHYTKTNKNGNYTLPVFDSTISQLLVLTDNNNNHRIDSGEIFHVIDKRKPHTDADTTQLNYLPTDIPSYNPIAERVYFGYRIHGFVGFSLHEYNDVTAVTNILSLRPMVTIQDTLYLLTDSIGEIPFNPMYAPSINLLPKNNVIKHAVNYQVLSNPADSKTIHVAFSKPLAQSSNLFLLAPNDTLQIIPDIKAKAPFTLTINLPTLSYSRISIPDSSIRFSDGSYFQKQLVPIPVTRDTVSVSFKQYANDTAYYLILARSKTATFYTSLRKGAVTLRLPIDEYSFLIFHDTDRNGFITPSTLAPYKPQEHHYTIPNYLLRQGIDTEETILSPK
jgi:hypothetical protein